MNFTVKLCNKLMAAKFRNLRFDFNIVKINTLFNKFIYLLFINFNRFIIFKNFYKQKVEGTLSVQPQANPVVGFEEHFLGLTVENNQRNPWFVGK